IDNDENSSYVTDLTSSFSIDNCNTNSPCNFTVQNSGVVGLRIIDAPDKDINGKHAFYEDNKGGYNVTVNAYKCPSINGTANSVSSLGNLIAVISDTTPDNTSYKIENINGSNRAGKSGTIWLKVNDVKTFTDNSGSYDVLVKTTGRSHGIFSDFVQKIIGLVETKMDDASIMIFKNITCSGTADKSGCVNYFSILKALLILYIIIYSTAFTFGLIQISQFDLVTRIFKISVITAFMTGNSWEFFYTYFFRIFGVIDSSIDTSQGLNGTGIVYYLIDLMTGGDGSNSNAFYFVDKIMRVALFDQDALTRLFAILFTSLSGVFFFIALIYFLISFSSIAIKITISYIIGFIYSAIMLVLAPLFIPCFLFSITKPIFDSWVKYMIRYTLEP
ncbi:MAG: hypothetical protein EOP34_10780, partial [Rickettsiales bacterium]